MRTRVRVRMMRTRTRMMMRRILMEVVTRWRRSRCGR